MQAEKSRIKDSQKLKEELDSARQQLEVAQREGDLASAGKLAYGLIPELEKKIKSEEEVSGELLKWEVTEDDIASVVSKWTGIPVEKMMGSEQEKLLKIEDYLQKLF